MWYCAYRMPWAKLSADVRLQQQHAMVIAQRRVRIADDRVALQMGHDGGMQAARRDEVAEGGEPDSQHREHLAQRPGFDFDFRDARALARDAQEFHVHGVTLTGPHDPVPRQAITGARDAARPAR